VRGDLEILNVAMAWVIKSEKLLDVLQFEDRTIRAFRRQFDVSIGSAHQVHNREQVARLQM
jgi:hypothetical protein